MSKFKAFDEIIRVAGGHSRAPIGFVSLVQGDGVTYKNIKGDIDILVVEFWELTASAPVVKPQEPTLKIIKCEHLKGCYFFDFGEGTVLFDEAAIDYNDSLFLKRDSMSVCLFKGKNTAEVLGLLRALNIKVKGIK